MSDASTPRLLTAIEALVVRPDRVKGRLDQLEAGQNKLAPSAPMSWDAATASRTR